MTAQPFATKVDNPDVVKLLTDNIHHLEHPLGWIKHPYLQERFSGNPAGVHEVKKRFCEAVVLLLEKNGKLAPKKAAKKAAPRKRTTAAKEGAS